MEMLFCSSGINNYLDIKIEDREIVSVNKFRIRMLQENKIEHLLMPVLTEIDGKLNLKYKVDTFYVLNRLLMKLKPDGDFLRLIIGQILECLKNTEEYLLDADDIVLAPEYMFYDYQKKELSMIYIPGYRKNTRLQLKQFIEYIMKIFDHRDKNGVAYLYQIYDMVAGESFDYEGLKRYVSNNKAESNAFSFLSEVSQSNHKADIKWDTGKEVIMEEDEDYNNKNYGKENCTEIIVLDVAGAMVLTIAYVLGENKIDVFIVVGLLAMLIVNVVFFIPVKKRRQEENQIQPLNYNQHEEHGAAPMIASYNHGHGIQGTDNVAVRKIVPLTNGGLEAIELEKFGDKIVIGRSKKETDYRIPVTQISRIHAHIFKSGEEYYIQDLNSTNGTFLNYIRLQEQQSEKLKKGDLIIFANEEFFVS